MESNRLEMLKQIADALAAQFGPNCEVVIHDLSAQNAEHPIVYIVNGHVTGRKVGDGASYVVVEQLTTNDPAPRDHLAYLTRTPDGKILKSSTVYIRNSKGKVSAILAINYDISKLLMVEGAVHDLISTGEPQQEEPEKLVKAKQYKHMTFYEAADMAKRAGVREMWLTHYSPSLVHAENYLPQVREIFPDAFLGKDGKNVELMFEDED